MGNTNKLPEQIAPGTPEVFADVIERQRIIGAAIANVLNIPGEF